MSTYAISGYEQFHCLMGQCAHTCCAGWEIDIDGDRLEEYRRAGGALGDKLREKIDWASGCFRLEADERCPFLTEDGLCEIILTLGKDSLCQICADHPRFRSFLPGRVEIGLGLCCEAAARLLLSRKEKTRMILLEDDGQEEDEGFLAWRESLLDMARDRALPVAQRADRLMLCAGAECALDKAEWAAALRGLERLDRAWDDCLAQLEKPELPVDACWEIPLEQLLVYLLYRHLPNALEDGDASGHLAYCVVIWRLLRHIFSRCQTMEGLVEAARLYSSEIEYSDENVDAIMALIDEMTWGGGA